MEQKKAKGNDYIPSDYEDLYLYYIVGDGNGNSLTHKLIRHFVPYSTIEERESLAHDIFLRILDKNLLDVFDESKANFGGLIFFTTRSICVNYLSKKSRNPLTGLNGGSISQSDPEDGIFEPGVYSLDRIFGTEAPNHENRIFAERIFKELTDWAYSLKLTIPDHLKEHPRHRRDASLYDLILLLREQNDVKECGNILGVTSSTIHNWQDVLKKKLQDIMAQLA